MVPEGRLSAALVGLGAFGDVGEADDAVGILLPDLLSIRQVFLHKPGSVSAQGEPYGLRGRYGFHDDDDEGALLLCDGGGGADALSGRHRHRPTRADKGPGDGQGLGDAVVGCAVPFAGDRCRCQSLAGCCGGWAVWYARRCLI